MDISLFEYNRPLRFKWTLLVKKSFKPGKFIKFTKNGYKPLQAEIHRACLHRSRLLTRGATLVHQQRRLLPFFPPICRIRSHSPSCQWSLYHWPINFPSLCASLVRLFIFICGFCYWLSSISPTVLLHVFSSEACFTNPNFWLEYLPWHHTIILLVSSH